MLNLDFNSFYTGVFVVVNFKLINKSARNESEYYRYVFRARHFELTTRTKCYVYLMETNKKNCFTHY